MTRDSAVRRGNGDETKGGEGGGVRRGHGRW